jgi:hypothetical protein
MRVLSEATKLQVSKLLTLFVVLELGAFLSFVLQNSCFIEFPVFPATVGSISSRKLPHTMSNHSLQYSINHIALVLSTFFKLPARSEAPKSCHPKFNSMRIFGSSTSAFKNQISNL